MISLSGTKNVGILVVSCDRYSDLWEPFFHCLFKYWPDCPYQIYLGSGAIAFNNPRVRTLYYGNDISYSDNLSILLDKISECWVVTWVDDRFLSETVDTLLVQRLIEEAQCRGAAYSKLIPEGPLAIPEGESSWGMVPTGTRYRVSMTIGLWQKDLLKQLLIGDESAWEIERLGSVRSDRIGAPFLALTSDFRKSPPLRHIHVVIKGRLVRSSLGFLRKECLTNQLKKRVFESRISSFYVWSYHLLFRTVDFLRRRIGT